MTGTPSSPFSRARWKTSRILALRLPHVLVEELGALDIEEVAPRRAVARALGYLLGQRIGHGLGNEGLAATGGAVEQDALGRGQLVLGEQVTVQEGQLDGIGYLLDLGVEPADIFVGDVGDFLQDQFFDLRPGQLLQ